MDALRSEDARGWLFDAVAAALKVIAFDGVCTIEIAPKFHSSTPEESKPRALESLATWKRLIRSQPA
jgi:hypothetical protein